MAKAVIELVDTDHGASLVVKFDPPPVPGAIETQAQRAAIKMLAALEPHQPKEEENDDLTPDGKYRGPIYKESSGSEAGREGEAEGLEHG